MRISGRTALYTVVGSHINDGTSVGTLAGEPSLYPHGQRNVPSTNFSKHWLKDTYQSNFKKKKKKFALMKITFKCIFAVVYFLCFPL